ncbi:hypothetical protein C8Q75DRAFT_155641 [Abortiporus biennis]|nr:hypothetical protein C8Q75DRAFT_155641 [Abortiporus biennis]
MDDMRRLFEVFESFIPRFTIPNSELRSPRIPWEICLLVIAQITHFPLYDNLRATTLRSCSLTCHAFFHPSRQYLYETVQLRSDVNLLSFLKSLRKWPHLQGLTTKLVIDTRNPEVYHYLFLYCQTALPNLQSLCFIRMPQLHPSLISMHRPFPSVTSLRLRFLTFSSLLDFRRLIDNFFPNLSRIELSYVSFKSSHVSLPNRANVRSQKQLVSLSHLQLEERVDFNPVQKWLMSMLTSTSIHSLEISPSDLGILLSFGQNLQVLRISPGIQSTAYPTEEHISFGEDVLPTLKTMAVYFRMSTCISQFCAMFSRCSPSFTLSCVQLWLYTNAGDWDPSTDAWNQLDDTLFILPPHTRVEIDVEYWEHLPRLKKKGILLAVASES